MKRKRLFIITIFIIICNYGYSQKTGTLTGTWGDQGNGTYINPVLNADYSDPDVIRVNDDFYLVCSEFHFMGIPVLHSKDLVNWEIIARVYDEFKFAPEYDNNERYAGGSWAPALRFHDNKFWLYFCTPQEGLFMTTAEKPEGPWAPVVQVVKTPGWEDPCPFWDDNGQGYLGRSKVGAGPIYIHKLSEDGKKLLDDGVIVYTGPVAEGTKIHKLNNYYYLSIPEGGVTPGWQTVLRSKNIYGPYEKRVVLEQGSTSVNGPHQGAWIDLPNGEWWFMHFQHLFSLGRVCHLQPMRWKDDWPVMGIDIDMNGIGEPVYVWEKPDVGESYPITAPQTSDEFNESILGFQWAWNHNPLHDKWSLTQRSGYLSLISNQATSFLKAKNTLTQKIMGFNGEASTLLVTDGMENGQKAGLCVMGRQYDLIGILKENDKLFVFTDINGEISKEQISGSKIYLRVNIDLNKDNNMVPRPGRSSNQPPPDRDQNQRPQGEARRFPPQIISGNNQFFYSTDNDEFYTLGDKFAATFGNWKGPKIGLFSYHEDGKEGIALFDWFHYSYDGPQKATD